MAMTPTTEGAQKNCKCTPPPIAAHSLPTYLVETHPPLPNCLQYRSWGYSRSWSHVFLSVRMAQQEKSGTICPLGLIAPMGVSTLRPSSRRVTNASTRTVTARNDEHGSDVAVSSPLPALLSLLFRRVFLFVGTMINFLERSSVEGRRGEREQLREAHQARLGETGAFAVSRLQGDRVLPYVRVRGAYCCTSAAARPLLLW